VLSASGVRKVLKLTCMLGAAWAGSSGLCQELFQAALDDPDTFRTSSSCYKACMKCWYGYLVCWGFADAAAGSILEGVKGEVKLSSQMTNMEQGKRFLCRNQLFKNKKGFQINLPRKFGWWVEIWA